MAHKKAGGSKARQKSNKEGKRLGVKLFGGQAIKTGQIILRQHSAVFKAGESVGVGRDYTIYALKDGVVKFTPIANNHSRVSVV